MTTELTKSHSPRLPRPSDYSPYVEKVLAKQAAQDSRRLLWLGVTLATVGAGCLVALFGQYGAIILALICLGLPSCIAAVAVWQCYRHEQERKEEI